MKKYGAGFGPLLASCLSEEKRSTISGVIFLDKPRNWTSRKAVNEVARLLSRPGGERIKAGHAGTLDPMATGMLPVLLGEATRFAEIGLEAEKTYQVTFDLRMQTDTLDSEGEVIARFDTRPERQAVLSVANQFTGPQQQVPPAYSAIRIDGQRAYAMARKGSQVVLKPRPISIQAIDLLDYSYPFVALRVRCSKGSYIRALARDMGAALDAGGCVTDLRRLSTGG